MYEGAASTDQGPSFMSTFIEAMFDGGLGGVLVVGLGGLFLVPFSRDWLEKYTETDETILAARNSFPHMLYGVSFAAGALYTFLFVFWLAIFSFTGEVWDDNRILFYFFEVRIDSFFGWLSVIIALLTTFTAWLLGRSRSERSPGSTLKQGWPCLVNRRNRPS